MKTSITDIPRIGKGNDDEFQIGSYEKGLSTFIENTSTPITIALQGEWGSGKTSLMNVLREKLCNESSLFHPVWINTWEYSLMSNPTETMMQILGKMVSATSAYSKNNGDVAENVKKVFGTFLKFGAKAVIDKTGFDSSIVDELCQSRDSSVSELRNSLQISIDSVLKETRRKGFIFFVDDLDRIDPSVAVEILELLKNIFTLENCVFVLAIDYDVVVKGLKPKFGELTLANEREFRSFFDKIIQVPFSMPVARYNVDSYIVKQLLEIGVLNETDTKDEMFVASLVKSEQLTIGCNPRSIKRFINTLSLIKCIGDATNKEEDRKEERERKLDIFLNISLVGMQVAYPKIYNILAANSDFVNWDDKALSKMGVNIISEEERNKIKESEEFDETWEQVLYAICQTDAYLKRCALQISQLFNKIRDSIFDVYNNDENQISECIENQLSFTSITGISSKEQVQQPMDKRTKEYRRELKRILLNKALSIPGVVKSEIGTGKRLDQLGASLSSGKADFYFTDVIQQTMQIFLESENSEFVNAIRSKFKCGFNEHRNMIYLDVYHFLTEDHESYVEKVIQYCQENLK